jgi:hypothetical protein
LINQSEIIASQIFERIGVKLRWSCEQSMFVQPEHSKTAILIRLAGNSPKHLYKGYSGMLSRTRTAVCASSYCMTG